MADCNEDDVGEHEQGREPGGGAQTSVARPAQCNLAEADVNEHGDELRRKPRRRAGVLMDLHHAADSGYEKQRIDDVRQDPCGTRIQPGRTGKHPHTAREERQEREAGEEDVEIE